MDPTHEFGEIAYFQRRMFSYISSKTSTYYPLANLTSSASAANRCRMWIAYLACLTDNPCQDLPVS